MTFAVEMSSRPVVDDTIQINRVQYRQVKRKQTHIQYKFLLISLC